jgi:predicted ATPase
MIKSIHFQNFKALRDATLPLGPFTLIVGPNGSGKSTAMQALRFASNPRAEEYTFEKITTAGLDHTPYSVAKVSIDWLLNGVETKTESAIRKSDGPFVSIGPLFSQGSHDHAFADSVWNMLRSFRIFSFEAEAIAAAVQTEPQPELGSDGSKLAAVLDGLRDSHPERFEALNVELSRWLPEFDRILFETPSPGRKAFLLRTKFGSHQLQAVDLSQGVLFGLAFLALAYLPTPPSILCFEEPDRGIHPRLLIDIRDAMYRLAFPKDYGENRQPVQVIATTHSPYLLDLYKDHPEQIVIAHKDDEGAHFERLSEKPHISELLEGAPLGDIWFSGILGGVPASP